MRRAWPTRGSCATAGGGGKNVFVSYDLHSSPSGWLLN
jgi:hypothetical protein